MPDTYPQVWWLSAPIRVKLAAVPEDGCIPYLVLTVSCGDVVLWEDFEATSVAWDSANAKAYYASERERGAYLLRQMHDNWKSRVMAAECAMHGIMTTLLYERYEGHPKNRPAHTWSYALLQKRLGVGCFNTWTFAGLLRYGLIRKHVENANFAPWYTANLDHPDIVVGEIRVAEARRALPPATPPTKKPRRKRAACVNCSGNPKTRSRCPFCEGKGYMMVAS